jgi:hypothetical protein
MEALNRGLTVGVDTFTMENDCATLNFQNSFLIIK